MARLSVQKKKRSKKNLFERAYGKEADYTHLDHEADGYEDHIYNGLSWYRNNSTPRDEKRWTLEYLVNNDYSTDDVSYVKTISVKLFSNKGRYFRMMDRGAVLGEDRKSPLDKFIKKCLHDGKIKKESTPPKKSVQEYINEQVEEYLSALEIEWDNTVSHLIKKETVTFSMYSWLKSNNVKTVQVKRIGEYWKPMADELLSAINKEDPQLVEGYSYVGRVVLKKMHKTLIEWISDCDKFHQEKKATRKKRKKKIK